MPRLMSVALTEEAVLDRRKTVTRRLGWTYAKRGERIQLVRKAMGRKRRDGSVEPLVRIVMVELVSVTTDRLDSITDDEVAREGFGDWVTDVPGEAAQRFVEFFCRSMRVKPDRIVTRIEWRYLDEEPTDG